VSSNDGEFFTIRIDNRGDISLSSSGLRSGRGV
jgi:hypothetical protein